MGEWGGGWRRGEAGERGERGGAGERAGGWAFSVAEGVCKGPPLPYTPRPWFFMTRTVPIVVLSLWPMDHKPRKAREGPTP